MMKRGTELRGARPAMLDLAIGVAVQAISGFQGLSGEITYAGTTGIPDKAVPINRIVDGEDVLVATIG